MAVRSDRAIKKTGQGSQENRYYLSSRPPSDHTPAQWLAWIRGHWAGVEIRNHWRRDALMGEDDSRSRNPTLLANLALIRSALLELLPAGESDPPLPETQEKLQKSPAQCLRLINAR